MHARSTSIRRFTAIVLGGLLSPALASHGGGGGTAAPTALPGAAPLERGATAATFRYGLVEAEGVSEAERLARGIASPDAHFESIDRVHRYELAVEHGLTDDLTVGVSASYRDVVDYVEIHAEDPADPERLTGDISGFEDLWIRGRWRMGGHDHGGRTTSLLWGLKLPTGDSRNRRTSGGIIELGNQPSSGSLDAMIGLAHARPISRRLDLDAGVAFVARGEGPRDERLGHRIQAAAGLTYRLTPEPEAAWRWSGRLGVSVEHDQANRRNDSNLENSGATVVFLSPGLSLERDRWTIGGRFEIPVSEDFRGNAQGIDLRFSTWWTWFFGGHAHDAGHEAPAPRRPSGGGAGRSR